MFDKTKLEKFPVTDKYFPTSDSQDDVSHFEVNIVEESGGSLENGDKLWHDFCIDSVLALVEDKYLNCKRVNLQPRNNVPKFSGDAEMYGDDGAYWVKINATLDRKSAVIEISLTGTSEKIKPLSVRFGGHIVKRDY